jgi:NitT/TauT family transport system permease protein
VAISVFLFIFLNVLQAVRDVDEDLINIVKVMGASQYDVLSKVVMPSVMAALFVGLKQSVPAALRAAVLGEMMAGNWGLGATIRRAGQVFDSTSLFAAVFIVMVLGALLNELVNVPEARLLRWRRRGRDEGATAIAPAVPAPASV